MIKTERVIVRKFTEEDIENLYQVLSDSEVMVHIEPVFDSNKTKDFVSKYGLIDNPSIYAIEHINDNKVIGHFIENKSDNE
ncbi:MAG: GNAT family N-acetyltransferase [Tissierellia bacterium]|nr:GNAT family N-acetyltransferase [Tissierellia bacterium]